ncbi:hypothetical protein CC1G_03604 [Coprinopsis cinerea okayama7|uniref:Uncharacterized protein n=1 Tax=Coprinopsis cinerea (strain Okayama-7 / 130 / ATCC MYA-4618 / FGSC 9003) TaxID=240176 RepID=A8NCP6_COPC7|nr:hypothetical protein CC1G_03604 [Coprinopsis cinerea okayama7\|eukprot:XP_001832590.1 hypothetical protein CC1G_03604 [Coprinopsis cinerea okayama7\
MSASSSRTTRLGDWKQTPTPHSWEDTIVAEIRHLQPPSHRNIEEAIADITSRPGAGKNWEETVVAEIRQIQRGRFESSNRIADVSTSDLPPKEPRALDEDFKRMVISELQPIRQKLDQVVDEVEKLSQEYHRGH